MRTRFLIFAGLALVNELFSASPLCGQRLHVDTYTVADGLPSSAILEISQDSSGILWILTRNGVAFYDGWQWTEFHHPDNYRIRGEEGSLTVGPLGEIWLLLGVEDPTLMQIGDHGDFAMNIPSHLIPGGTHGVSTAVAGDSENLVIAIGTPKTGAIFFTNGRWSVMRASTDLPSDHVNDVMAVGDRILIATDEGICSTDGYESSCFDPFLHGAADSRVVALATSSHANGTNNGDQILLAGTTWIAVLEDDSIRQVAPPGAFDLHLPSGGASLTVGPGGELYLGTPQRLVRVDPEDGTATPLGPAHGLAALGGTALFTDREKNVWVGSLRGLSKIVPDRFASYTADHGLLENEVSAIAELRPGTLVFGHNFGLTFFENGQFNTHSFTDRERIGADPHRVMDLDVDDAGALWVAASQAGIAHLNSEGIWTWFGRERGVLGPAHAVLCVPNGVLAGTREGLFRFTQGESAFEPVDVGDLPDPGVVRRLERGADGTIYVATAERGLYVNLHENWYSARHHERRGANLVTAFHIAQSGQKLVGTDLGVFGLDDGRLVELGDPWSSFSRPVYFMVSDTDGVLWLGTDHGLLSWDGRRLRSFDANHSLAGNETNRAAGLIDSSGRLWVGTDGGVSFREPGALSRNTPPPIPMFLGVETTDGRLHPIDVATALPHTETTLVFRFLGVSLIDEKKLRYKARLTGLDQDWLGPTKLTPAGLRYTRIPHGTYQFEFQVENLDGAWSRVVSSAPLTIASPFWLRSWFLTLTFAAMVLVTAAVFRHFQQRYRIAFVDSLTGLANRAAITRHIERALEGLGRKRRRLAVLLLDLDRFKHINSSLGHRAGDEVLVQCAARLRDAIPKNAALARLGEDEFVVLLSGDPTPETATTVAKSLQMELAVPFQSGDFEAYLGASAGIRMCADNNANAEHLLRDANAAMLKAKSTGPGRTMLFDTSMREENLEILTLEGELKKAISRKQLVVHYQPFFYLATGELAGFEALIRWNHPGRTLLYPRDFLAIAEDSGLIVEIGNWVLLESCRQLAAWRNLCPAARDLTVSVNFSSQQVADSNLVDTIRASLAATGLPASALTLELTENSIMGSDPGVIARLEQLRAHDLCVWIDDFGTGYSSLSYLQKLPINGLKIDRSFVLGLDTDDAGLGIVETVLSLGKNLGLTVIAEGIETGPQFDQLKALGCDLGQGFHLGRPMVANDVNTEYLQGLSKI